MIAIHETDAKIITFFRRISVPMARIALFVIFFWFGILKVIGLSPAGPLVQNLYEHTIDIFPFGAFYVAFGLLECAIGIMFVVRGLERIVIPFLMLHMITTFMPLFLLPTATWSGFMVPTLEGQYIIKNLALIACAVGIAAHLHPLPKIVQ